MNDDNLCYWPGSSPSACDTECHFMQAEGFCILAYVKHEPCEVFNARIRSTPPGDLDRWDNAAVGQLEAKGGFPQARAAMVLCTLGEVSARA
jgi:hypothetical protein